MYVVYFKKLLSFWRIKMDWRDVSIMVSYQIKKREKKGAARKKKETLTIFVYT
jgi:hypothetical protein